MSQEDGVGGGGDGELEGGGDGELEGGGGAGGGGEGGGGDGEGADPMVKVLVSIWPKSPPMLMLTDPATMV